MYEIVKNPNCSFAVFDGREIESDNWKSLEIATAQAKHPELLGLARLHTSKQSGYVSRKRHKGLAVPYSGKFGTGFKLLTPRWDTTRFCDATYYVKP